MHALELIVIALAVYVGFFAVCAAIMLTIHDEW